MIILGIDGRLANAEERSGAGRFCWEVLQALGYMVDSGVRLRVYIDRAPLPEFSPPRATVIALPPGPYWTHRVLAGELRASPPDVFFSPVTQLPLGCPCPSLVSVLDLAVRSHPSYFPWRKRLAMRLQTGHAIRRANHLLAISETTARDLARYYNVPDERVTVAHPGCTEAFFEAAPAPPNSGTILDALPERYVLYVGQVQPRKNLLRLMDAYERVCRRHPDLPHDLVLAGGMGWRNDTIYKAARTSPVAHRIHFLDFVPDAQMPALVAGADALALVSLHEGFGLPVLEAMAAGTAVLASDVAALREVAGGAAVLVDPLDIPAMADGLARLLTDPALRTIHEQQGRARAQRFRWERTAEAIADAAWKLAGREWHGQAR